MSVVATVAHLSYCWSLVLFGDGWMRVGTTCLRLLPESEKADSRAVSNLRLGSLTPNHCTVSTR